MYAEHAISVLVPVLVLAVLWAVVRHWILPTVPSGFARQPALGRELAVISPQLLTLVALYPTLLDALQRAVAWEGLAS